MSEWKEQEKGEDREKMESRYGRFETNTNKKRAESRQKPERMDKGFIGSQGPKGTVVVEEKLYIYIYIGVTQYVI